MNNETNITALKNVLDWVKAAYAPPDVMESVAVLETYLQDFN